MSSYRSSSGAWDGGPPGAEAEYAAHQPPPPSAAPAAAFPPQPRAMPTTDPWTGVSYTHYGAPPNYDYQAYQTSGYNYNYDSTYYQRSEGGYYNKYPDSRPGNLPAGAPCYDYTSGSRERSGSPGGSRSYERRRRSDSRSVSPYDKRERTLSRKRDSSYEGSRRSESRSRSVKSKRTKYSSSDHSSSRSRSHSRTKRPKKRMSASSHSSGSDRSYENATRGKTRKHSLTPPFKRNSRSQQQFKSQRTPSPKRSRSRSSNDELRNKDAKSHSSSKDKYRRDREVATPPPKTASKTPPHKMSDRSSVTPPKSYQKHDHSATPPKNYRGKRNVKDRSLTPPKSYARSHSSSSSKSRSRSVTPRQKRRRSRTPKSRRSSSRSSSHSSSRRSLSKSRRRAKAKSSSNHRSRTKSRSRRRSLSKSRSRSRNRSNSKGRRKSESSSHSKSRSKSRSRSGSPSEDERRGQFTVADRKRFWKLHRDRIEEKVKAKSPPMEIKPPADAIEKTKVDDVEYGDPPEVEGPNFAELLPSRDQLLQQGPSTSRGGKNIPIAIKNDGSFLEMFKKMQEETKKIEEVVKKPEIKKPLPFIGKRRGGRVLKTGMVKKAKAIDEQTADNTPKDAWSLYMQEVKKYRETSCEEERKTRPLVK